MPGEKNPDPSFWAGKRVLLTGHTGFKGAWLALWLDRLGAKVIGISLPPATTPSIAGLAGIDRLVESHIIDIRDADRLTAQVRVGVARCGAASGCAGAGARRAIAIRCRPSAPTCRERPTSSKPCALRVLPVSWSRSPPTRSTATSSRSIRTAKPTRSAAMIRTAPARPRRKSSLRAIAAPISQAQGIAVASARAGNVIGGGDWSEDRLIPDAVRAWQPAGRSRSGARRRFVRGNTCWSRSRDTSNWPNGSGPTPELAGAYNFGPPHAGSGQRARRGAAGAAGIWQRASDAGARGTRARMKRAGSRSRPRRRCTCWA